MKPEVVSAGKVEVLGGSIIKLVDINSPNYFGFGELYFSTLGIGIFRGWKIHGRMNCLLFVASGRVSFHIVPVEGSCYSIEVNSLGEDARAVSIPPGVQFGFKSLSEQSVIGNFADLPHSPDEQIRPPLGSHECGWTA